MLTAQCFKNLIKVYSCAAQIDVKTVCFHCAKNVLWMHTLNENYLKFVKVAELINAFFVILVEKVNQARIAFI